MFNFMNMLCQESSPRGENPECTSPPVKRRRSNKKVQNGIKLKLKTESTENPNKFGSFVLCFKYPFSVESDVFTLQFDFHKQECQITWKEKDGAEEAIATLEDVYLGNKHFQKCPSEAIESFQDAKTFYLTLNKKGLWKGENVVEIYINPIHLNDASEQCINRRRCYIISMLRLLFELDYSIYREDFSYENDEKPGEIYENITNTYNEELSCSANCTTLIPQLRPYQSQAVIWMINREVNNSETIGLNPLYMTLTLRGCLQLYFHKYGGFFVDKKYPAEKPIKGGILADEMGLGKTLEVLACILLNPRSSVSPQNKKVDAVPPTSPGSSLHSEMEIHFECVCGLPDSKKTKKKCIKCGIWQHTKCVLYDSSCSSNYICPYCWINNSVLQASRATLIISPASILYQWQEEILKHVKKDYLKVFMYEGVEHQKFIDPCSLGDNDVVLISYETLRKELNHVDVPHGTNGRSLRQPKKFMTLPSPLCSIEWWRIALDEAQMVESVSTKAAKMLGKLHAINRWCVSGTPFKKSVEDLYGLLVFLEMKPYDEKVWWDEVLWRPYTNGVQLPIMSVLNEITWRTTKAQVSDQIGIPELKEEVHELSFSALEKIFYDSQHLQCKTDFLGKINRFLNLDIKLYLMDKNTLSKILMPLRILQMSCSHCAVRSTETYNSVRTIASPSELLDYLLKKSKYDCEDVHRKLIMALSGLAGIYAVEENYDMAVKTYEKALELMEENKTNVRTDVTQRIHCLSNLSSVLISSKRVGKVIETTFNSLELNNEVEELTKEYVEKTKDDIKITIDARVSMKKEITDIMKKFKLTSKNIPTSTWWLEVLKSVKDETSILNKLVEQLNNAPGQSFVRTTHKISYSLKFSNLMNVKSYMLETCCDLYKTRKAVSDIMELVCKEPTSDIIELAISCHLRSNDGGIGSNKSNPLSKKCLYCKAETLFIDYESKLFRFEKNNESSEETENSVCFSRSRRGTHADSDYDIIIKFFYATNRRYKDIPEWIDINEDAKNEIKLLDTFKKEFKVLRLLWMKNTDYVSQVDEIEMAKISVRLLYKNEEPPVPPVPYIICLHEIQSKRIQYNCDVVELQSKLNKKLRHLIYLQNIEKSGNKDRPFDESCPICKQEFGNSWSTLQCGHSFCLVCISTLLNLKIPYRNEKGKSVLGISCAICRQKTPHSGVYYVDSDKKSPNISIKGSYSTKTMSVIKCLLNIKLKDPNAKSLVFSTFAEYLYGLESALQMNDIKYFNFCKKTHFQDQLRKFKESDSINVLLIPFNFGSSGLNLTEATNILMVEPILDDGKYEQALGRIHRIGQTKVTTVHRFIIRNTIEQSIYQLSRPGKEKEELTLQNIKDIFLSC